jgi:hypothetical protein
MFRPNLNQTLTTLATSHCLKCQASNCAPWSTSWTRSWPSEQKTFQTRPRRRPKRDSAQALRVSSDKPLILLGSHCLAMAVRRCASGRRPDVPPGPARRLAFTAPKPLSLSFQKLRIGSGTIHLTKLYKHYTLTGVRSPADLTHRLSVKLLARKGFRMNFAVVLMISFGLLFFSWAGASWAIERLKELRCRRR